MNRLHLALLAATSLIVTPLLRAADPPPPNAPAFTFRDVTQETGLLRHVAGIRGHAAGWGDVDSDTFPDLYVAAFHAEGSKPNQFFRNVAGKFQLDPLEPLRHSGRPTGSVFADLDNDGDDDLYVSSMPKAASTGAKPSPALRGCALFRNDGAGRFTDVSADNAACPPAFGGRSATVLDFDGDGLLDLLVGEDPLPGYNGSKTRSTRLFRNKGNLRFEDATQAAGIPADLPGYGVAAADVNNDTLPDLFVVANNTSNLLLLNAGNGRFKPAPNRELFHFKNAGGDNMVCGVAFGDVNHDGLLDLVLGQHFQDPWRNPVPNRLYLNRGVKDGVPTFEDVTDAAGLPPLPMKSPHVELQDFDNDGHVDLYTSVVKFSADGKPHPLIFRNPGVAPGGVPRFTQTALAVNDFPTPDDRAIARAGQLFDKVNKERKITYTAPGPSADFDNDGRLDLFLASWWLETNSMLLRNETPAAGHWLAVKLEAPTGTNRQGIGARVNVYPAGRHADPAARLASREIATGYGYASAQLPIAHIGLGTHSAVDVEILLPHNKGTLIRKSIKTNQHLTIKP
jgi:hypothetical protein